MVRDETENQEIDLIVTKIGDIRLLLTAIAEVTKKDGKAESSASANSYFRWILGRNLPQKFSAVKRALKQKN